MSMPAIASKSGTARVAVFAIALYSLAACASAESAQSLVYMYSNAGNYSIINITGLGLSPSAIYFGGSADVAVTMYNNGTVQNEATVNVRIFNAQESQVDSFEYSPAVISPNSEMVLIKSWSSGTLPAGAYCANATASYDSGANSSNTFSTCFTIINLPVVTPPPSAGGPSSGGPSAPSSGTPPTETAVPSPLPDTIKPVFKEIRFLKSTVLREVVAGTSTFESFTIKNDDDKDRLARIVVTGPASSWISFQPAETALKANEERVINLALSVPTYAIAGDYLVKIQVGEKEFSSEFMIVRVKSYKPDYPYPVLLRTVKLDRLARTTTIGLNIRNLGNAAIPVMIVKEELPAGMLATKGNIAFLDKPGNVSGTSPIRIQWKFSDLQPNEIGYATYSVPIVLEEYSAYAYWPNTETAVPQKDSTELDLMDIRQIYAPELAEGEFGDVTTDIFYAGLQPASIRASLEGPLEFSIEPQTVFETLAPRGVTRIRFTVRPPAGSAGTHILNVRVISPAGILSKSTTMHVSPREMLGLGALFSGGLLVPMAFFAFAAIIAMAAYSAYKSLSAKKSRSTDSDRFRSGRDTYLGEIKELMEK